MNAFHVLVDELTLSSETKGGSSFQHGKSVSFGRFCNMNVGPEQRKELGRIAHCTARAPNPVLFDADRLL